MGEANSDGREPNVYDSEILHDVHSKLSIQVSDTILNLGSGTGILEKNYPSHFIVSLDFASAMLRRPHILNGIRSSATYLPFRGEVFDKILAYSIIQYLSKEEVSEMLNDISNSLNKNRRKMFDRRY